MDDRTKECTGIVLEEFLKHLQGLDWTQGVQFGSGPVEFPHGGNFNLSGAAATAGGLETLEQLSRGTIPRLCDRYRIPYQGPARLNRESVEDDYAWSAARRDPRILAEVDRLVAEARKTRKAKKRSRADIRLSETKKQIRALHQSNIKSGLSAARSLETIRMVVDELSVADVLAS